MRSKRLKDAWQICALASFVWLRRYIYSRSEYTINIWRLTNVAATNRIPGCRMTYRESILRLVSQCQCYWRRMSHSKSHFQKPDRAVSPQHYCLWHVLRQRQHLSGSVQKVVPMYGIHHSEIVAGKVVVDDLVLRIWTHNWTRGSR